MDFAALVFYAFGAILLASGAAVVLVRNPVHAALWLVLAGGTVPAIELVAEPFAFQFAGRASDAAHQLSRGQHLRPGAHVRQPGAAVMRVARLRSDLRASSDAPTLVFEQLGFGGTGLLEQLVAGGNGIVPGDGFGRVERSAVTRDRAAQEPPAADDPGDHWSARGSVPKVAAGSRTTT